VTPAHTRIFLVDDHALVREWLGNLLRTQPELAVCGESGEASTALAAMLREPPDLAIVDLSLASGSGFDLVRAIRTQLPAVKVIVLSMHEEFTFIQRAFRAGAQGYVSKREATSRILPAIKQVQEGRVFAAPEFLQEMAQRSLGKPASQERSPVDALSDRELEVFRRMGQGHNTRRIAADLGVGIKTVQEYQSRLKEKLGLADVNELIRAAVRWTEQGL
jgi:DNA-binding NarL/FixJ family response regulator